MMLPDNFLDFLSRHKDCTAGIFAKASTLTQRELDCSTKPEIIRIKRMVTSVSNELFLLRGFVRLKPLGGNVLHGYMKPKHDVGFSVGYRLAKRTPETIIILGNNRESWLTYFDGKKVHYSAGGPLSRTVEKLGELQRVRYPQKKLLNCSDEEDIEDLWKTYFWSQYCGERRNIRYYRQSMPKEYMRSARVKVASNTNKTTIDDFCTE